MVWGHSCPGNSVWDYTWGLPGDYPGGYLVNTLGLPGNYLGYMWGLPGYNLEPTLGANRFFLGG